MLIPSYGFCSVPPCEEFAENVCDEFFSPPSSRKAPCAANSSNTSNCNNQTGCSCSSCTACKC